MHCLANTLAFETSTAQSVRLEDQIIAKWTYETTNFSVCEKYLVIVKVTFKRAIRVQTLQ